MKFDQATIPIAPRTLVNCLDLALLMFRRGFGVYLPLWLLVTVPTCGLIYWLAYRYESHLLYAAMIAFVASGPLGWLTAAATVPAAFGDPQTVAQAWRRLGPAAHWPLLRALAVRLLQLAGLAACVAPGLYLLLRDGFSAERQLLLGLSSQLHNRRADGLLREGQSGLLGYALPLCLYGAGLWGVLLLTADFASSWLLGCPLFLGRLGVDTKYADDYGEVFLAGCKFLWSDPLVEVAAVAVALLVYVHLRIAWFLCYVDIRVRRDCWDIELQIIQETERLSAGNS